MIGAITVATVQFHGQCGDTRTEADFTAAVKHLIEAHPDHAVYHFVVDQLNTHKSEALVCYLADYCGIEDGLGRKGKEGVLGDFGENLYHCVR